MKYIEDLYIVISLIAGISIVTGLMYRFLSYSLIKLMSIVPVIQNVIAFTIYITLSTFYKAMCVQGKPGTKLGMTIMLIYFIAVLFAGSSINELITEKKEVIRSKYGNRTAEKLKYLKLYNIIVFLAFGFYLSTELVNLTILDVIKLSPIEQGFSIKEWIIIIYCVILVCAMCIFLKKEELKPDTNIHIKGRSNKVVHKYVKNEAQRAIRKNR